MDRKISKIFASIFVIISLVSYLIAIVGLQGQGDHIMPIILSMFMGLGIAICVYLDILIDK